MLYWAHLLLTSVVYSHATSLLNRAQIVYVSCQEIGASFGDVIISGTDSPFAFEALAAGPTHDENGHIFLSTGTHVSSILFLACNSTFLDWKNGQHSEDGDHVWVYGRLMQIGVLIELSECATRKYDGDVVWAPCVDEDGPIQLTQYWKMTKSTQNASIPAPIEFIGHPNGTELPFTYTPALREYNGTNVLTEHPLGLADGTDAQYQLYFIAA